MSLIVASLSLEDFAYIATIVLAAATFALLLAALWAGRIAKEQIAEQRRIEMRRRAYDHLEVFGSRKFTTMTSEASAVLRLFKEERGARQTIWAGLSARERIAVQTYLNFYEEIAHEFNAGFLDPTAADPLVFVAVITWLEAKELVEWLRRTDDRYFEHWAALYREHASLAYPEVSRWGSPNPALRRGSDSGG